MQVISLLYDGLIFVFPSKLCRDCTVVQFWIFKMWFCWQMCKWRFCLCHAGTERLLGWKISVTSDLSEYLDSSCTVASYKLLCGKRSS